MTDNQHLGKPKSPLIAPTLCCLMLLAPATRDLGPMSRQQRTNVRRNFVRILSAANIVDVPSFLYSPCTQPTKHAFAGGLARLSHQEFAAGANSSPWQHASLRQALSDQDRSTLVVAGFWLEHQIVATALHALVDSYDVYFVLDASPARMQPAVRLSQDRLIQAGATPVVASQVIHEWSLEAADAGKTAALNRLLLPDRMGKDIERWVCGLSSPTPRCAQLRAVKSVRKLSRGRNKSCRGKPFP